MATPASNKALIGDELRTAAHAWVLRPSELNAFELRDRWLPRLPAAERTRYERLENDRLRETYLASCVLSRTTLSRYTGADPGQWRFFNEAFGKPTIVEPAEFTSLRFNLTHTNDLVICAVTRAGDVGVDAEDTSQDVDALLVARHFLSPSQQQRLAALAPRARALSFFEQWVLKEAYVKATGRGLGHSSERLTIELGDDGRMITGRGCEFSVCRPTSEHIAAMAVLPRSPISPVSFEWLHVPAVGQFFE